MDAVPPFTGIGVALGTLFDDPDRLLGTLSTWDGQVYPGSSAILSYAGPLGTSTASRL